MSKVYDLNGNIVGEVALPKIFSTTYRPDVIQRAVVALQAARRQPYGTNVLAGKRTSAHYHGRRRYRFSMMNKELSRIPRIHGKGAGSMNLTARFSPHAVKGRRAHPPKVAKVWLKGINNKENALAIKSAIAATANEKLVKNRGHQFNGKPPIIIENDFEKISKTKDVMKTLGKIMIMEMQRCEKKKVRSGKGKMRGRKYKRTSGPLIVVSGECALLKAAKNIAGVDVVTVEKVNAELLAPGTQAGRIAVFTKAALDKLDHVFK